jgi:hypothetical protein
MAYTVNPVFAAQAIRQDDKPDPKKLEYCGYVCPSDCPMKKATLENSIEQKKKAYELFEFESRFGVAFDPEKIFCYGCKSAGNKPQSLTVKKCTVRKCVIEKNLECCIQCGELEKCDKELWTKYPEHRQAMLKLRQKYLG